MRHFLVTCCLLASVAMASRASAADTHAAGDKAKAEPIKVKAEGGPFKDGKKEKSYDLSDPEGGKEFLQDIKDHRVHEFEQVKKPAIIPERWDLGIWSIVVFIALLFALTKFAWKPMIEGLH